MRKMTMAGPAEASGSIIMWLAGLVFGVCAGLLLVYHLLLSSRAAPLPLRGPAAPAVFVRANAPTTQSIHREALRDAVTRDRR